MAGVLLLLLLLLLLEAVQRLFFGCRLGLSNGGIRACGRLSVGPSWYEGRLLRHLGRTWE